MSGRFDALRDDRTIRWLSYGGALAIGVLFVLSIFPADILLGRPLSDDHFSGDIAAHVAGQRAFLQDKWRWPLLWTTMLGWPRGVSIAMTDSIPLVALPLKLFGHWLPPGFTAIQLWLAFGDMMQPVAAVFALRSAGGRRLVPALAVAVIAVSLPSFLLWQGEAALSSHFTILLAIGAYFRTVNGAAGRTWFPPVLQVGSFLIHPYLGFMVAAILLAAPVSLVFRRDGRWRRAAGVVAGSLLLTGIAASILGYGADDPPGGFGDYAMNALAPFYPTSSSIISAKPVWGSVGWPWVGNQYLGLGLILLIVAGAASVRPGGIARLIRRNVGLILACFALTALALSNKIYVGHSLVLDLGPVPSIFQQLRISGRLFWPVAYLSCVAGIVLVTRRQKRLGTALLSCAALLQFYDTHNLRTGLAVGLLTPVVEPLDQTRLAKLVGRHLHLTVMPTSGCGLNQTDQAFLQIVLAASAQRVPINTMYTARSDGTGPCDDGPAAARDLDPGELRVFLGSSAATGPIAVRGHDDFCRSLGPIAACTLTTSVLAGLPPVTVPVASGDRTVRAGSDAVLGIGWYAPDADGAWSAGSRGFLAMQSEAPPGRPLEFVAQLSLDAGTPARTVEVLIDGQHAANWTVGASVVRRTVPIPPGLDGKAGTVLVEFRVPGPYGFGLGIHLSSAGLATAL